MRIARKKIFQFCELDERIQQRVLNRYRDVNTDCEWYDCTIDFWKAMLNSIGFTNAEIQFSISCSQGDGASFTSSIDLVRLAKIIASNPAPSESPAGESNDELASYVAHKLGGFPGCSQELWGWLAWLSDDSVEGYFTVGIVRSSSRYSHSKTCSVDITDYLGSKWSKEWGERLKDMEADIESLRYQLCECIRIDLEKEIEYLESDERVKEWIESQNIEFTESGIEWGMEGNDDE